MSYGPKQVFTCAMASAASTSSYIDTGDKSYNYMALKFPTMSTAAAISVYGCETTTGTFKPIFQRNPATSSVQYQAITIPTSVSGGWGVFDAPPFRYLQFIASATVTNGIDQITLLASD